VPRVAPHYQFDPVQTISTCLRGTPRVLGLGLRCGARIVFTSTSEVYGDPEVHPQPESCRGCVNCRGPRSCHDEGKRAAEMLCFCYIREQNFDVRTARLFNTYGPNTHPADGRVVSNLVMQALEGKDLTMYGDGSQTRSLAYVDDPVRGILTRMNVESRANCNARDPVNIGNPSEFTILEPANMVREMINSDVRIELKEAAVDDPKQRKPDIAVAARVLGWTSEISLQEGFARTIPYFREIVERRAAESTTGNPSEAADERPRNSCASRPAPAV